MKKLWIIPLLALGMTSVPALAMADSAHREAQQEARIPFVNHGGIRNWRMGDSDTIYIQDRHRDWYEATLMRPVVGLGFEWAIGFETHGADTLDRFANVVIDGQRYPLESLVRLDGAPPARGSDERKA